MGKGVVELLGLLLGRPGAGTRYANANAQRRCLGPTRSEEGAGVQRSGIGCSSRGICGYSRAGG